MEKSAEGGRPIYLEHTKEGGFTLDAKAGRGDTLEGMPAVKPEPKVETPIHIGDTQEFPSVKTERDDMEE